MKEILPWESGIDRWWIEDIGIIYLYLFHCYAKFLSSKRMRREMYCRHDYILTGCVETEKGEEQVSQIAGEDLFRRNE